MAIVLLVGASGSGKTTIGKELEHRGFNQLVSHTTRPMRDGEIDGKDYYFLENRNYEIKDIELVEYSEYSGNEYGLSKKEIENKLSINDNVYFICDRYGAKQIISEYPNETICFWIDISMEDMLFRLKDRGDSDGDIVKRLMNASLKNELDKPMFFIGITCVSPKIIDGRRDTNEIADMIEIHTNKIMSKRKENKNE